MIQLLYHLTNLQSHLYQRPLVFPRTETTLRVRGELLMRKQRVHGFRGDAFQPLNEAIEFAALAPRSAAMCHSRRRLELVSIYIH